MKKTIMVLLALAGVSGAIEDTPYTLSTSGDSSYSAIQWNRNVSSGGGYEDFAKHAISIITNPWPIEQGSFANGQLYGGSNQGSGNPVGGDDWKNCESSNVGESSFNIYGRSGVGGEWFSAGNQISSTVVSAASTSGTFSTSITLSMTTVHFAKQDYTVAIGIVEKLANGTTTVLISQNGTLTSVAQGSSTSVTLSATKSDFVAQENATYYSIFRIVGPTSLAGTSHNTVSFSKWTASDTSLVPEPATATLSLLALAGLAARRRRK